MTKKIVYGIYPTRKTAERAVDQFKFNEFRNTDISILFLDNFSPASLEHEKAGNMREGLAVGAGAGALVGGSLGWLAGLGALAVPGIGPFIAAGPIIGLLAGTGIGGTLGGVAGTLVGMGMPEEDARRLETVVKHGGVLLSVHCDNPEWEKKAADLFRESGAADVSTTIETRQSIFKKTA